MLRPSFTPTAGTTDIRTTITSGLTSAADPKFNNFHLSSFWHLDLTALTDGERLRLHGKRVKKRFIKKKGQATVIRYKAQLEKCSDQ